MCPRRRKTCWIPNYIARNQSLEHLLSICVVGLQALTNQIVREGSKPEWIPPADLDRGMTQFIQSSTHKEPKIVNLYLVSQGAVDLADKWNQPNPSLGGTAQLDIAPEKE